MHSLSQLLATGRRFAVAPVVALTMALVSASVCAGIMGDLNSMFLSNTTASGTISLPDRSGVFGGNTSMRAPIQNVNLVSFDAPRIDAGCGGVDLYGGSFTFINSAQLEAIFKKVAANAAGLAFKAAIKAISPSLDALLTEFQTMLQSLNNLAKNTCSLAHLITDPADKAITDALGGSGVAASIKNGVCSDAFGCLSSWMANATSYLNQAAPTNPKAGNQTVKAVIASGSSALMGTPNVANIDGSLDNPSDPTTLNNRILVSLLGYRVESVPCSSLNQAGSANLNQASGVASNLSSPSNNTGNVQGIGTVFCNGPATITMEDIVHGGGIGSARPTTPLSLYQCMNPLGSAGSPGMDPQICTIMQSQSMNYPGIEGWVNTSLFGSSDPSVSIDPGSIIGLLSAGTTSTFTTSQAQFLKQAQIPLLALLQKTNNTDEKVSMAQSLSHKVINCVAKRMGESLYKAASLVTKTDGYDLAPDVKRNIEFLRLDYLNKAKLCDEDMSVLRAAQLMDIQTRLSTLATNK